VTVAGALQVPGNGTMVLFLADHPVTGGYPVVAVVLTTDLPLAAQATPGQEIRVQLVAGPTWESPGTLKENHR
jgi:allophanate hydrolase subunit 2